MEYCFEDLRVNCASPVWFENKAPGQIVIGTRWNEVSQPDHQLVISWMMPIVDIGYQWHPGCKFDRALKADWWSPLHSKISASAPVYSCYSAAGRNRMTLALSDACTLLGIRAGVHEEDGTLNFLVTIPLDQTGVTHDYSVTLYRDYDDVSFAEALRRVTRWWEKDCGMVPMPVPDEARKAMYSFWYSFHQATFAADVERECARAAALGLKSVIVDDGWQTDDGNRGYAYCGDWEPTPVKIPDMKAHVAKVHAMGLKYILWYSVPFVGIHSKHWEQFKDKLLSLRGSDVGVLDPRYPEVRSYLVNTYVKALMDWDLDGFKLDFIDSFRPDGVLPAPTNEMDYALVEPAVDRLMTDVMKALKAIKPDILIEFRQSYIGPMMRTFGNMFRVADCPDDPISNRVGTIDLRLLSGNTAVHSDMLMWHRDDKPEAAALQLLSVIFAVAQISVQLDTLPDDHRALLTFWLNFMREHRDLLLDTPLEVEAPHNLYPLVRAEKDGKAVIALYDGGHIAKVNNSSREIWLLNATPETEQGISCGEKRFFHVELTDCCGRSAGEYDLTADGLTAISIPVSGMAHLTERE